MEAAYSIEDLTFFYPERQHAALDGVNLTIARGEFTVLCGPSGCGKTTLLRQLKPSLTPHGQHSGRILFEGADLSKLDRRDQSAKIGFVMQSPENQIVTDKVWHELAFGLESLGYKTPDIRLRVAEMASFFGIQTWFHKNVTELSGGQKQLLCLASVMALQPSVLILDEPTSQLDPIAAGEFIATIGKINRELGVTVILTEHRLEEVFPLCDRAVVMDCGKIIADGSPREVGLELRERSHGMFLAMPTAMRVWAGVAEPMAITVGSDVPVTIRDGKRWIQKMAINNMQFATNSSFATTSAAAVELEGVWFKYQQDLPDVIKGLNFKAYPGELTAILGGNGTGKTTMLSLIARLNTPYRGKIYINDEEITKIPKLFNGLLGVLPQNPQALFVKKTVREDLLEILTEQKLSKDEKQKQIANISILCRLCELLDNHPYDLSGGEQQRAALAKVLLLHPRILLLDEPTKGLDAEYKQIFANILKKLTSAGVAVIMVSHDVEFCAEFADRCALFFDGSIVSEGSPCDFFSGNSFYTSSANRIARDVLPYAVTVDEIISALGGEVNYDIYGDLAIDAEYEIPKKETLLPAKAQKKLTVKRKIFSVVLSLCIILTISFAATRFDGLKSFVSGGSEAVNAASDPIDSWSYTGIMVGLAIEAVALIIGLMWGRDNPVVTEYRPASRKLPKRTIVAAVMILFMIPLTIFIGYFYLDDRKYYFISLLIVFETMLPFVLVFEGRKPQARELVVISVLTAIAVAGRGAFFMLPQFKPVVAVVIIAGVAFGGESGFLVGALSGLVSNMFFGQGPWTPWQMFAFGIIGFLAGVLFRKGWLRRNRIALSIFGAITTVIVYGGLLNTAMVLMYQPRPKKEMFYASYLQGLPFDLVHAIATVIFLLIISQSMLEKLDRIKIKYGLIE